MDVKGEQVKTTSAFDLFKEYSHRATRNGNGNEEVRFNPGELKITDWRGWTDVISIERIETWLFTTWARLSVGNQNILVTGGELVPVYTSTVPKKGFHGASVFEYQLKEYQSIDSNTDFIRIRRGINPNGGHIEFAHPIIEVEMIHPKFGYKITTRSKFFNCNNVHIFGSDVIPDKMEVSR